MAASIRSRCLLQASLLRVLKRRNVANRSYLPVYQVVKNHYSTWQLKQDPEVHSSSLFIRRQQPGKGKPCLQRCWLSTESEVTTQEAEEEYHSIIQNTERGKGPTDNHEFQAETRKLLDIVAKSLYSEKEEMATPSVTLQNVELILPGAVATVESCFTSLDHMKTDFQLEDGRLKLKPS